MQAITSQDTSGSTTRETGAHSRRRSILALGGAGLLAAFAGRSGAEAKNKKNKNKKKCNKEKKQCESQVEDFCAEFDEGAPECETALLPCCDSCKVGNGVICVLEQTIAAR